jgi:1,2-phenylacetyl-CoA epoxidase PaaB subunit
MAKLTMDWNDVETYPQRGDVLRFPRTRYLVLNVRKVNRRDPAASPRYAVWAVREQEIDAELQGALRRSADRRGGPRETDCYWHPRKKRKKTFEQLMQGC